MCLRNPYLQKKKQECKDAGYIIIEIDDPTKVVVIDETQIIGSSDFNNASLKALAHADNMTANSTFVKNLYNNLYNKPQKQST